MKRSRSSVSPVDFYEREVLPALFASLDRAFPEFGWRRDRQGWTATKKVESVRADRVVCHKPFGFYVHGGEATTWLSYVHGSKPQGRDFVEAVRRLAGLAGVDASPLDLELSSDDRAAWEKRERKAGALEAFLATSKAALLGDAGRGARDYLESRGFTAEEIADLELGLYTKPESVKRELVVAGVDANEVEAFGLADAKWTGRLVGAMRNRFGRLETFFARDLTGKAEPKYLYLAGATKPDLFGLDVALRTKEGREDLALVEGVLDVVLLHARGLSGVAAIGGANLSTAKLEKLHEAGVRRVTLALDYDPGEKGFPGLEGTKTTVENAYKGHNVPVVYAVHPNELQKASGTPEGQKVDPDSLVRAKGLQAFRDALSKAEPGSVFLVRDALSNVTPASTDRQEVAARAVELVDTFRGGRSPLDREDALRLVAERTGYDFGTLSEVAETAAEKKAKEARERELRRVAEDVNRGLADGKDAGELARDLGGRLARLTTSVVDEPPAFSVDRLFRETRDMPPGRTSGWSALDAIGVAFYPGELAVVGARTGHCKTTFLVGLLANWLRQADVEGSDELFVLYSSEEPEVRIFHRLLALLTEGSQRWSANEIRDYFRGGLGSRGEDYTWPAEDELQKARETLSSWEDRLLVVHRPRWDAETIASHARGLAERRTIGGVFVDYLQRIPAPPGSYDRRDIEVSAVARSMKALAVELIVPVVTGAQINREAAGNVDRSKNLGKTYKEATGEIRKGRPELHHLREGGSEQEADMILGLLNYRADFATDSKAAVPRTTLVEVGTLKSRYGEVGRWAGLAFDGRYHLLRDPEESEAKELEVETSTRSSEEVLQIRREKVAATKERTVASLQKTDKQLQIELLRHEREKMALERAKLQAKPEAAPETEET